MQCVMATTRAAVRSGVRDDQAIDGRSMAGRRKAETARERIQRVAVGRVRIAGKDCRIV